MEENQFLPKITVVLWILRTIFLFTLSAFVFIILKIYFSVVFLLVSAGIITVYLLLFLKGYKIVFSDKFLKVEYGLIFRTTRIIPFNKIIYIKVLKTPILKAFGVSIVIIKSVNSTFVLPELETSQAEKLKAIFEEKNL